LTIVLTFYIMMQIDKRYQMLQLLHVRQNLQANTFHQLKI